MTHSITIPMPGAELSMNSRAHWTKKNKAKKKVQWHTKRAILFQGLPRGEVLSYQLHFIFPNKIRRDIDNFTTRCKPALDAISDHVGQDDSFWGMQAPTREIIKGKNEVRITITFKRPNISI